APFTVVTNHLAPMGVSGVASPAGIARDPTCSTESSNCWAVTNVTSATTYGGDTDAVYWIDDQGHAVPGKGPIPKGDYNPFGIAVTSSGDVYFIDIGLTCNSSGCDTVNDGGVLYKVS